MQINCDYKMTTNDYKTTTDATTKRLQFLPLKTQKSKKYKNKKSKK